MKITKRTHILFIALIVVIVFSGSLKNDFAWDDKFLIINNPYVKNWNNIPLIFSTQLYDGSGMASNFYRPLQLLSYAVDYSLWQLNPFGYHLTSLLLHVFNSILAYLIVLMLVSTPSTAFLTALLFAVAPAVSSITYYLPARSDLLMAFFVFLSVLFFIMYRKKGDGRLFIISIISYCFSLLCKEMAIMLPLLLIIVEFFQMPRKKMQAGLFWPYGIITLIYVFFRAGVLNFAEGGNPLIDLGFPVTVPLWARILTDFKILLLYMRILLVPFGLHIEWFVAPAKTIFQIDVLSSIALCGTLVFIIRKISAGYRMVLFGAAWFFLSLLPVLNIYPISVFFGEGWLYVPSVGFFVAFSIIFQNIISPRLGKVLSRAVVVFFIIYCALVTISYGKTWKDSISIFKNVIKYEKHSPFIYLTYNNLGIAYYDKAEFEKSIEYCKKSISSNPGFSEAYNNLGVSYMAVHNPIKAIAQFKKAISLKRDYISGYCNLAHAYNNIGLRDKAVGFSKLALELDPDSFETHCNLGYIYSDKGEVDQAIKYFEKAKEIKKGSYEPSYYLGGLYIKKYRFKTALDEYNNALALGLEDDYGFYNELAYLLIKNNRYEEAELALIRSLALNSNQSEPHNNLG
ncbi:MAG: tetratricopeptide repeat protein, partial [Candidatus Omnitrophica bacterium]|nr:tetratricopeptide repeat protein [Candidatus Omnitrophota bacterium]